MVWFCQFALCCHQLSVKTFNDIGRLIIVGLNSLRKLLNLIIQTLLLLSQLMAQPLILIQLFFKFCAILLSLLGLVLNWVELLLPFFNLLFELLYCRSVVLNQGQLCLLLHLLRKGYDLSSPYLLSFTWS